MCDYTRTSKSTDRQQYRPVRGLEKLGWVQGVVIYFSTELPSDAESAQHNLGCVAGGVRDLEGREVKLDRKQEWHVTEGQQCVLGGLRRRGCGRHGDCRRHRTQYGG